MIFGAITLEWQELTTIILLLVFAYLAFRMFEMKWSYKISKPHSWDHAVKKGEVSAELRKFERTYRDKVRFYSIWLQIRRLKKKNIEGAFAELGVYQGETAEFIHEMDASRDLHLFDTFEGFHQNDLEQENSSDVKYSEMYFSDTSLKEVRARMGNKKNIYFHPGLFPDSAKDLPTQPYALVNLDADLYAPTLAALKYFYPQMSSGGVIIIHDYNHTWNGLTAAVDEFCQNIPEVPFEVADWQGSVMIIKN